MLARLTRELEEDGVNEFSALPPGLSNWPATRFGWPPISSAWGSIRHPRRELFRTTGFPSSMRYPAVLKPVDGAGSVETFYLDGPGDLSESARRMPQALLQPFVPGEPMSASLLVSRTGRAWLIAFGRQRIELHDGRIEYHGGEIPASCPDAAGSTFCTRSRRSRASPGLSASISSGMSRASTPQFSKSIRGRQPLWSGSAGSCRRAFWRGHGSRPAARRFETKACSKASPALVHAQEARRFR